MFNKKRNLKLINKGNYFCFSTFLRFFFRHGRCYARYGALRRMDPHSAASFSGAWLKEFCELTNRRLLVIFWILTINLICLIEWITWYIKLKIKLVIGKAFARNCKQAQTLLPNWVVRVLGGRRPHLVPALLLKQEDKLTETRHENITDGSKCPLAVKVSNKEGNRRPGGLNVSGTVSVDSLHERSRLSLARRVSLFANFNIPQVRVEIFHSWLGCAKIW